MAAGEQAGRLLVSDRNSEKMNLLLQYKLVLNVTEYFERSYQKWQQRLDSGNMLALLPRWVAMYTAFPEHIKYWRAETERLYIELYGKQPDF